MYINQLTKTKQKKKKFSSLLFKALNFTLLIIVVMSLLLPFLYSFIPATEEIKSFLERSSIIFPILSFFISTLYLIKFIYIFLVFKYKGELIEDFLVLLLIASFLNFINLASGSYHNAFSLLNEINQMMWQGLDGFSESIFRLIVLYFRTFQYVISSFAFSGTSELLNLPNSFIVSLESLLSIIYSIGIILLFSYLTVSLFLSNLITKIKLIFRKEKTDRFLIFTDIAPAKLLSFIGNIKSTKYLKVFITETMDHTRAGQDYRKQLEFEDISVVSVNLNKDNLRAIIETHQHPHFRNLYVFYYSNAYQNKEKQELLNEVIEEMGYNEKDYVHDFGNLIDEAIFERTNQNFKNIYQKKSSLIKKNKRLFLFYMKNRFVVYTNRDLYLNAQVYSDSSKLIEKFDFLYANAYVHLLNNIEVITKAALSKKINKIVNIFIGNGDFNFYVKKMIVSLYKFKDVEFFEENYKLTQNINIKNDMYYEHNIIFKEKDMLFSFIKEIHDQHSKNSIVNFYVDFENSSLNKETAILIREEIKKLNNKIVDNNSIFAVFYDSRNYFDDLSDELYEKEEEYLSHFSEIRKEELTSNKIIDSQLIQIDNYCPIFITHKKSTLECTFDFIFNYYNSFLRIHLGMHYHSSALASINDKTVETELDQKWGFMYSLLFDIKDLEFSNIDFNREEEKELTQALLDYLRYDNDETHSHSKASNKKIWENLFQILLKNTLISEEFIKKAKHSELKKNILSSSIDFFSLFYLFKRNEPHFLQYTYLSYLALKVNLLILGFQNNEMTIVISPNNFSLKDHNAFYSKLISSETMQSWEDVLLYENNRYNDYWQNESENIKIIDFEEFSKGTKLATENYGQSSYQQEKILITSLKEIKNLFFLFAKSIEENGVLENDIQRSIYEAILIGRYLNLLLHFPLFFEYKLIKKAN